MTAGIWATIAFDNPDLCPIARISAAGNVRIDSVTQNAVPADCGTSITEFSVDRAGLNVAIDDEDSISPLLTASGQQRYRLSRTAGIDCPCECIGCTGAAVNRYIADDGYVKLEFCVRDFSELQGTIGRLRELFPTLDLQRLIRSPSGTVVEEIVQVDRAVLSTRQREVLQLAYEHGYFDRPRQTNVDEIATMLDLHPSTVSEHLALGERKVLEQLF